MEIGLYFVVNCEFIMIGIGVFCEVLIFEFCGCSNVVL